MLESLIERFVVFKDNINKEGVKKYIQTHWVFYDESFLPPTPKLHPSLAIFFALYPPTAIRTLLPRRIICFILVIGGKSPRVSRTGQFCAFYGSILIFPDASQDHSFLLYVPVVVSYDVVIRSFLCLNINGPFVLVILPFSKLHFCSFILFWVKFKVIVFSCPWELVDLLSRVSGFEIGFGRCLSTNVEFMIIGKLVDSSPTLPEWKDDLAIFEVIWDTTIQILDCT